MYRLYYDVPAEGYEELYGEEQAEKYEAALKHLDLHSIGRVLDVGCGVALLLKYLRGKGFEGLYIGIDILEDRLRHALRLRDGFAEFIQADAEHLPFREKGFDLTTAFTVIHLLDQQKALEEMLRVSSRWLAISVLKRGLEAGGVVERALKDLDPLMVADEPNLKDRVYLLDVSLNRG